MEITDVKVKVIRSHEKMRAICSITIDSAFVVHDIRLIDGQNRLFIAMPSKKIKNEEGEFTGFKDIAHPINSETRKKIEDAVLKVYYQEKEQKQQEKG